MKVYIASRWKSQARLRLIAEQLNSIGIEVTSSWLYAEREENPAPEFFKKHGVERASRDISDLLKADSLILDLLDGRGRRGGQMFETGFAHALDMPVFIVGEPDCVFTQLFDSYATWEDFFNGKR